MMKKIKMDRGSYEKLQEDMTKLEKLLSKREKARGENAISQGDNWFDAPGLYQEDMSEISIRLQLSNMKKRLYNIEIVETSEEEDVIYIGDTVTIALLIENEEPELMTIKLVGYNGDITSEIKEVSTESPLGESVYGKKVGEQGEYRVGTKKFKFQVIEKVNDKQQEKTIG